MYVKMILKPINHDTNGDYPYNYSSECFFGSWALSADVFFLIFKFKSQLLKLKALTLL